MVGPALKNLLIRIELRLLICFKLAKVFTVDSYFHISGLKGQESMSSSFGGGAHEMMVKCRGGQTALTFAANYLRLNQNVPQAGMVLLFAVQNIS